jgi:multisubunit Na+/H+ antiporter MnhG subunit
VDDDYTRTSIERTGLLEDLEGEQRVLAAAQRHEHAFGLARFPPLIARQLATSDRSLVSVLALCALACSTFSVRFAIVVIVITCVAVPHELDAVAEVELVDKVELAQRTEVDVLAPEGELVRAHARTGAHDDARAVEAHVEPGRVDHAHRAHGPVHPSQQAPDMLTSHHV